MPDMKWIGPIVFSKSSGNLVCRRTDGQTSGWIQHTPIPPSVERGYNKQKWYTTRHNHHLFWQVIMCTRKYIMINANGFNCHMCKSPTFISFSNASPSLASYNEYIPIFDVESSFRWFETSWYERVSSSLSMINLGAYSCPHLSNYTNNSFISCENTNLPYITTQSAWKLCHKIRQHIKNILLIWIQLPMPKLPLSSDVVC